MKEAAMATREQNIELLKARLDGSALGLAQPNHHPKEPTTMQVEKSKLARRLGLPANAHESMIRARLAGLEAQREITAMMAAAASTRPQPSSPVSATQKPVSPARSVGGHSANSPGGLGINVDAEPSLIEAFRRPADLAGQLDRAFAAPRQQEEPEASEPPDPAVNLAEGPGTGWFDPNRPLGWTRIEGPPLPRG
jgi:hypothetical protein